MFKRSASGSNWNLEVLVFMEKGKPENAEKSPQSWERTSNKLNPHEALSTVTEVEAERMFTRPPVIPRPSGTMECYCLVTT